MHRFARAFLVSVPACAVLLAAKPASADLVDVGVGVIGAFGGNFIGKGSAPANQDPNALTYPGFGGTTLGYGFMLDVRVLKFLGIEVDFIKMQNRGHGDVTFTKRDGAGNVVVNDAFTVEVGQDAWHVPVLAKVVLPSPLIAPFAELGPEFVFVGSPTATVTSGPTPWPMTATASNYTMFTFGVGFELKLPLPELDIRIPLTIRGSYNPSVPASASDRQTVTTTGSGGSTQPIAASYNSQFEWQALATLGAGIYF